MDSDSKLAVRVLFLAAALSVGGGAAYGRQADPAEAGPAPGTEAAEPAKNPAPSASPADTVPLEPSKSASTDRKSVV